MHTYSIFFRKALIKSVVTRKGKWCDTVLCSRKAVEAVSEIDGKASQLFEQSEFWLARL